MKRTFIYIQLSFSNHSLHSPQKCCPPSHSIFAYVLLLLWQPVHQPEENHPDQRVANRLFSKTLIQIALWAAGTYTRIMIMNSSMAVTVSHRKWYE